MGLGPDNGAVKCQSAACKMFKYDLTKMIYLYYAL